MKDRANSSEREYLLSRSLDGDLRAEDSAELRRRLAGDPAARDALGRYRSLEAHLRAMGGDWTEAQYDAQREAIMARVRQRVGRRPRRGVRRGRLVAAWGSLAAAAVVALALAASFFLPGAGEEPVVSVTVLPASAPSAGPSELLVEARPLRESELPLAGLGGPAGPGALPAGTVLVSAGGPGQDAAAGRSAFPWVELYR